VTVAAGCSGGGDETSPAPSDYAQERKDMVRELESLDVDHPITSQRVLDALRVVPRHEFLPSRLWPRAYEQYPLAIGENQTISAPYIVALMTQLLDLKGAETVLEIGTGSGYQAAVLGELAREVYTVEIRESLYNTAKKTLKELKQKGSLHYEKLETVLGDGSKGHLPAAPYDAIVVTAAPRRTPVELTRQLKKGGRLVVPEGDFFQTLKLIRKREDGSLETESIVHVRFVPMK
jgi:protein-L-isoaspartate(D-aspartate) O-methyltransferase